MKRLRRKRAGRPRLAEGRRHRNGRHVPVRNIGPTPETVRHRERLAGSNHSASPEAGYALGILYLRDQITRRHHDAGIDFLLIHKRWCILNGLPPRRPITLTALERTARTATNAPPHPHVGMIKRRLCGALEVLARSGAVAYAAVDSAVIDDVLPDTDDSLAELKKGLETLAVYFRK